MSEAQPFKAETRQLLDILVHSLYTDREIFLRELISNASDALTRFEFEQLTRRDVLDPETPLEIRVIPNPDDQTLTIRDTGLGMTAAELADNLGTIARSGAREFLSAYQGQSAPGPNGENASARLLDVIGRFGVGFYSAFMAAQSITVESRSFLPEAGPARWFSEGGETFTIGPGEKTSRGTEVILKLREDAQEFLQEGRLREIVRKHSDFIPYPIYVGESQEQTNRQTALWRQNPHKVKEEEYHDFYRQLTLDFEPPLAHAHLAADAPVQMYALLFIPPRRERSPFSLRRDEGLKLYAKKVLIQEYSKDLLPEYFRFVEGVVDSEDLPLNVSRETVQASQVMSQLKRLITNKVIDTLKKLAEDKPEQYAAFWKEHGQYLKHGVAIEQSSPEVLYPLLRFSSTRGGQELISLDDYLERVPPGQQDIYYLLGDDPRSLHFSPHLDLVRRQGYEVLLLSDPVDSFMVLRLEKYQDRLLTNLAHADLPAPAGPSETGDELQPQPLPESEGTPLLERFKTRLGERVSDVRLTERLSGAPARLVDPEGAMPQHLQRVYRYLKEEFEAPKKVLELNSRHPIITGLAGLPADSELSDLFIEQIYENALLLEGLHPDPAGMVPRLQRILELGLPGRDAPSG